MAHAVPKRVLEFTAGRAAARAAMADIGIKPAAIPSGDDRAPIWPDGLIGSIAHCDTACIAAVAQRDRFRSTGIDIEEATPLAEDLWGTVCTPAERAWLASQPADQRALLAKVIFSAKEAVYKAQYPLTGRLIGFDAVQVDLLPDGNIFTARFAPPPVPFSHANRPRGRFAQVHGLLISVVTLHENNPNAA